MNLEKREETTAHIMLGEKDIVSTQGYKVKASLLP